MNDNRHKLTGILKLLYENTDDSHSMDTYQIMDALETMGYGRPDRKTIDANIKFITEDLKFGIVKEKGKPNRYKWTIREFDLDELKMIADAVNSAGFIGRVKTREIIAKLKDLTSVYKAASLNRDLWTSSRFKRDNPILIDNSNSINDAITSGVKVTFNMASYDSSLKETISHDLYKVSPFAVVLSDDCHYMIGRPAHEVEVKHYRLDLMRNIIVTAECADTVPPDFEPDNYKLRVFDMFSGEIAKVELDCRKSAMQALIDRFGREFQTTQVSDERFTAKVTTDVSPAFFAWVFGQEGSCRITSPQWVCDRYSEMLRKQI